MDLIDSLTKILPKLGHLVLLSLHVTQVLLVLEIIHYLGHFTSIVY